MERVCFTFDIYAGKEVEYKKRHDEIWPELVAELEAAGYTNYTIFQRGLTMVGYLECVPDKATAFGKMANSEVNAKWAKWFEEIIVNLTDGYGNLLELKEIWHMD